MTWFLSLALGGLIGAGIVFFLNRREAQRLAAEAKNNADKATDIVAKAEAREQEILVKAKEKAIKIIEEARVEEKRAAEEIKKERATLGERENELSKKLLELDDQRKEVEARTTKAKEHELQVETLKQEEEKKLQEVAGLSKEQAMERMFTLLQEQQEDAIASRLRKLDQQEGDIVDKKAKNILALAVQRLASSTVAETTTTNVNLPNDEMKGRIIGREGRNIKALELLTGCELIVDDTPSMITISGFSPIRRQVAKHTIEKLVADGRIHPGRIEEIFEESKRELAIDIKKSGEDALFQMGISMAGIDPKLIQILGRLKYRTSYGQNALMHSMEVGNLAALMAEELGADVMVCKKGGLFHDVGKAVDHDMQGSHPELGYQIMKKFGFPEEICYQSISHHEDKPHSLEGVIVKAADAISGARPGARKDSLEFYVKRLEDLEKTAMSFEGVEKVYAIQAGREIRVFLNPKAVDDFAAAQLAKNIATKIEAELTYPGEVRVTLIRETRITEYAR